MRARTLIRQAVCVLVIAGCVGIWFGEFLAALDLFSFEIGPLLSLMGACGLVMLGALNIGIGVILWRTLQVLLGHMPRYRRIGNVLLVCTVLLIFWALEWMFMPLPLTARLTLSLKHDSQNTLPALAEKDFAQFSLAKSAPDAAHLANLRAMYARVRINSPEVFDAHPIGATIDKYATQYDVNASYVFYRNYLNSWYGEAPSGPLPFLREMTAETVRDVVQIHLPSWFVESPIRTGVISSESLRNYLGATLSFKVRYALHKATLDVSSQPYDLNTFADIFLVLKEYPREFADLLESNNPDPLRKALRESFRVLRDTALRPPYVYSYGVEPYNDAYYAKYRRELMRFARAAYYLCALDFDFATRTQALLTKFERDYYIRQLGQERWTQLPEWERIAMLAMVRDLYQKNVGHLAYNVYALPELNCAPLEFVAHSALDTLPTTLDKLWRPKNYDALWAGAGYQLHVLNEVLTTVGNPTIPGIDSTETVSAARQILTLNE